MGKLRLWLLLHFYGLAIDMKLFEKLREASKFTSQTMQTKGEKTMNMPTLSIGATGTGV